MDLQSLTIRFVDFMWSGPIILYFCGIGFILTIALCFMQFRGFFKSIKYSFAPSDKGVKEKKDADLTPFQAFLSVLSASLGNGSLAGMGVAIAAGGPGAAFWLLIAGFFVMIIRYAEVYLGSHFIGLSASGGSHGGPVAYLSRVPGGKFLPYLFSFFCLLYGLSSGNAMQCNSVRLALVKTLGVSNIYIIALCIILFLLYVLLGGAHRIIAFSDSIVPVKVVVFFVSAVLLVVYHYASILPAIKLMAVSAFSTKALAGGVVGATVQKELQLGF
ncbi:sodium:alanine symporter family protein, partial [bacterium]|nr:sodium:alanine symporter family protein [bacterium]